MTYIIAEVGGNHDGNINTALELIYLASEAGADAVKFQTFTAEKLVSKTADALPQARRAGYTSQLERFKDLEFSEFDWERIIQECKKENIDFLTTCFDPETLRLFSPRMKFIKIASGDLTYKALLREARATGKHVLLSSGMSSMEEINEAVRILDRDNVTVLHCVSAYPTPDDHANLGVITSLKSIYSSVGYSDHTVGITACLVALGLGAEVIEKHFTLDSSKEYGDHPLSAEFEELKVLVEESKRISLMLGVEKPDSIELINKNLLRRGVYAAKNIPLGVPISEKDIIELRPATRCQYNDVIGRRAKKPYSIGMPLDA